MKHQYKKPHYCLYLPTNGLVICTKILVIVLCFSMYASSHKRTSFIIYWFCISCVHWWNCQYRLFLSHSTDLGRIQLSIQTKEIFTRIFFSCVTKSFISRLATLSDINVASNECDVRIGSLTLVPSFDQILSEFLLMMVLNIHLSLFPSKMMKG